MAQEIQVFDQQQLDNIKSETTQNYTFGQPNDNIRAILQDEFGFEINRFFLQKDRDYIVSENSSAPILIKPNDILDSQQVPSGTYNLRFVFYRNILDEANVTDEIVHVVSEISTTRTELRVRARTSSVANAFPNSTIPVLFQGEVVKNKFGISGEYNFDYIVELQDGTQIPITNLAFDFITDPDDATLILKLNESVPTNVDVLEEIEVLRILKPTYEETVFYVSEIPADESAGGLQPDTDFIPDYQDDRNQYESYNDLINSASIDNDTESIIETFVKSEYKNLSIDLSKFENHTVFGNAEQKLVNFDYKVKQIEGKLQQLSQSLAQTGSTGINERRKDLFSDITDVKKKFTPIEKFLYFDNQSETTSSAPGVGTNLADPDFSVRQHVSASKIDNSYDGFNSVYKINKKGSKTRLFTEKYQVQSRPFFNVSSSVYLSFLMKATPGISSSLYFTFDDYTQPPYGKWSVPEAGFYREVMEAPTPTTSSYTRFIFQASASHWIPTGSIALQDDGSHTLDAGTMVNTDVVNMFSAANENIFYKIVHPSTDSLPPIYDSSGRYGTLLVPSTYSGSLLDYGVPRSGSIAPSGDLFNIGYSSSAAPASSSFITDIKVSLNNPTDTLPFSSIYNTTSSLYSNWYGGIIQSASAYDSENIHSLINNLPEHYKKETKDAEFRKFVYMIGELFDIIYMHVSNYTNMTSRKYKVNEAAPSNLVPILAQSLGWNCLYAMSSSLSQNLGFENNIFDNDVNNTLSLSNQDVNKNTWQKVLNNLVYIYKSKGTLQSIRSLLGAFGISPDLIQILNTGGSTQESNPAIISNDTKALLKGLGRTSGNVSFKTRNDSINMIDLTTITGSNQVLSTHWWTQNAKPDGLEFIIKPKPTRSTSTITTLSGSAETLFDIRIIPSASHANTAKVSFRLNSTQKGTGSISAHPFVMETPYISNLNSNKLWNVFLTRTVSSAVTTAQTFKLYVANQDGDTIPVFASVSSSVATTGTGSFIIDNFTGTGSLTSATSSLNLKFGSDYTGSIAEIRAWKYELSASKFKQHVLNKKSAVENTVGENSLIYHYKLNETNSGSATIKDAVPKNVDDFSLSLSNQDLTGFKLVNTEIKKVSLSPRTGADKLNDNSIIIDPNEPISGPLSVKKSVQDNTIYTKGQRVVPSEFSIVFSITNAVNEYIIDTISDYNTGDKQLPGDYYSGSYASLDSFRETLLQDVSADLNSNIDAVADSIGNILKQAICDIVPAKVDFVVGYEIKGDMLQKNKMQHLPATAKESLPFEMSYHTIDSASFNRGRITGSNETTDDANIYISESFFATANQELANSTSIAITESYGITQTIEDAYTSSIAMTESYAVTQTIESLYNGDVQLVSNTADVNPSSSYAASATFEASSTGSVETVNSFGFQKTVSPINSWGTSSNDTHFISFGRGVDAISGSLSDFNTYHYEDSTQFISIGDNEWYSASINYVTCSDDMNVVDCNNDTDFDYTNYKQFYNQKIELDDNYLYDNKYSSSINLIKGRPVGSTLYFTESNGQLVYPSNHATIVGSTKTMIDKLIYEGTQNDGTQPLEDPRDRDQHPTLAFSTSSVAGSDTLNAIYVKRDEKK